jgi:hypothetical protein
MQSILRLGSPGVGTFIAYAPLCEYPPERQLGLECLSAPVEAPNYGQNQIERR